MNIDDHVNSIVQNIVAEITTSVQAQVAQQIDAKISAIVANLDTSSILSEQLSKKLDARISQLPIDTKSIESQLSKRLDKLSSAVVEQVQQKSMAAINDTVAQQVNQISFRDLTQTALITAIQSQTFKYPDASIPGSAIDTSSLSIGGDIINGGIIKNFGSTGIDDKATDCRLSIFDETTVVENNLLTKDLTVKGTVTVEGDLNVTGTVPENSTFYQNLVASTTNRVKTSLDQVVFTSYADLVFAQIKQNGLDLSQIKLNGQDIVSGPNLGNGILNSNLQKVGLLKELQVSGESLLSGTLYVTNQRVGVNTIEPGNALSVWDQEIEIGFGKQSANTAFIGTPRTQSLILSSNGKNNLTLTPDGAISVNQINLGYISIAVSTTPPTGDQPKGSIVFNANPSVGGPMGWISLGDARWANFGIID